MTNGPDAPLAAGADVVLPLLAGRRTGRDLDADLSGDGRRARAAGRPFLGSADSDPLRRAIAAGDAADESRMMDLSVGPTCSMARRRSMSIGPASTSRCSLAGRADAARGPAAPRARVRDRRLAPHGRLPGAPGSSRGPVSRFARRRRGHRYDQLVAAARSSARRGGLSGLGPGRPARTRPLEPST